MKTKSFVRFINRVNYLDVDIEFADIIKQSTKSNMLNDRNGQKLFCKLDSAQHPKLATRAVTTRSRNHAAEHLQSTIHEAFIKHLYEDMTQYFREIVHAAAQNGLVTQRLVGDHKVDFSANDILTAGSWNNVVSMVADSVFRTLENEKSTLKLLDKLNKKLNLSVPQSVIVRAMPYLEIRHLLVHSNGVIDKKYCDSYPNMQFCEGQQLKVDTDFINNAKSKIIELVKEFDDRIVQNGVVSQANMQP